MPIKLCADLRLWVYSFPSKKTAPEVIRARPVSMLIVVLFPAPLGPRKPKISPPSILKLTPSTAVTPGYSLTRFSAFKSSKECPNKSPYSEVLSQGRSAASPWHTLICSGLHSEGFPLSFSGFWHCDCDLSSWQQFIFPSSYRRVLPAIDIYLRLTNSLPRISATALLNSASLFRSRV